MSGSECDGVYRLRGPLVIISHFFLKSKTHVSLRSTKEIVFRFGGFKNDLSRGSEKNVGGKKWLILTRRPRHRCIFFKKYLTCFYKDITSVYKLRHKYGSFIVRQNEIHFINLCNQEEMYMKNEKILRKIGKEVID